MIFKVHTFSCINKWWITNYLWMIWNVCVYDVCTNIWSSQSTIETVFEDFYRKYVMICLHGKLQGTVALYFLRPEGIFLKGSRWIMRAGCHKKMWQTTMAEITTMWKPISNRYISKYHLCKVQMITTCEYLQLNSGYGWWARTF